MLKWLQRPKEEKEEKLKDYMIENDAWFLMDHFNEA